MTQPAPVKSTTLNLRAIVSVIETIAFVLATVFTTTGVGTHDALITALVGLIAHSVNHPAGGSPV